MDERRILALHTSIGYVLGILLYILFLQIFDLRTIFSDLLIDKYELSLTLNKNIELSESIQFNVKSSDEYRMLYRYWKAPVVYRRDLNEPFIKLLDAKSKEITYFKDYDGRVYLSVDSDEIENFVKEKALLNELGIINLNYFKDGVYNLKAIYNIFPPIQTDGKFSHINIKFLSKDHVPIKKIVLKINDPNKLIVKIFPHIPHFKIEETEYGYLIEGDAIGGIVETEFLLIPYQFKGFIVNENNIEGKTSSSNRFYVLYSNFIKFLEKFLLVLVFTFPVLIYFLYKKYGEEKFFTIPKYLHYIPNKNREPFEVNFLFSGDAVKSDINGFIATVLNLAKKGYVKIKRDKDDIELEILKDKGDTLYEDMVLEFLKNQAIKENNRYIFSLDTFRKKIESLKSDENLDGLKSLKSAWDLVINAGYIVDKSEHIDTTGKKILTFFNYLLLLITFFLGILGFLFIDRFILYNVDIYPIFILISALTVEVYIVNRTKTQIFGRWKKDYYKEYLEWQAFKNMLSDLAVIKKYKPEDMAIWKDWLVYGTALGVADKVIDAMNKLNIKIPEFIESSYYITNRLPSTYLFLNQSITSLEVKESVSNSSSGGGGFGVGGGFGGGGIGGR